MIKKILNSQAKSISLASIILMGSYFLSALLGLFRDRLLAGKIGTEKLDVYYAAFTIPDFIALMLIFGAISAAIIPIFSSYLVKSKEEAWQYISAVFNNFLTFLIIVSILLIIFAPLLITFIAPGFSQEKKEITILLMRIMFLSPIILGISNIISGILQVFQKFLVTALAPLMYNIGIITGIIFFVPLFGLPGLALGVVFGAFLHLLIQLPVLFYSGFSYQRIFSLRHPGVLQTFKLMVPRSLGLGAGQFNTIVTTAIASTLASGSVAIFNLANNLSAMLVNAIAISLSTAVFPVMSLAYSREDIKDFEKKFSGAFRQALFLIIPLSILIFILRAQIVRVVLGTGKFSWLDTRLTAASLGIFSMGLLAQGLIFILSKTFYAAHNTKIPAVISVLTVALNILMSFFFVWLLSSSGMFLSFMQNILVLQDIENIKVIGLALAFTITAIIEALLLLFFVYKKLKAFKIKNVLETLYKIIISSIIMTISVFFIRQILVLYNFVDLHNFLGVFLQLMISGLVGVMVYIFISYLLKSKELNTIRDSFFTKNGSNSH